MKGPSGSPYDFIPKIAGFGSFSRVRDKTETSGAKGLDYICNQRYSKLFSVTSPVYQLLTVLLLRCSRVYLAHGHHDHHVVRHLLLWGRP